MSIGSVSIEILETAGRTHITHRLQGLNFVRIGTKQCSVIQLFKKLYNM